MTPRKALFIGAAALAAVVIGLAANTARQAARLTVADESPGDRAARLAAHWRLDLPGGPGPYPAAILLSGCDGVRDNMDFWARQFRDRGRATLVVDSHTPRGLDRLAAWRLVCAGQALPGAERAGDIAVALDALAGDPRLTGDVVLFGASHGGWAAMEFVDLAASGARPPPGLAGWPAPPAGLLAHVSGIVLLYPYCGLMNGADPANWAGAPPALMVLAGADSIVGTEGCLALASSLRATGATVDTVVLPGADHGFDQRDKAPLSTLGFDAGQRDAAREAVAAFLDRHGL